PRPLAKVIRRLVIERGVRGEAAHDAGGQRQAHVRAEERREAHQKSEEERAEDVDDERAGGESGAERARRPEGGEVSRARAERAAEADQCEAQHRNPERSEGSSARPALLNISCSSSRRSFVVASLLLRIKIIEQ